MTRPLLQLALRPLVYAAAAAYWLVVASLVEAHLGPIRVRADRRG